MSIKKTLLRFRSRRVRPLTVRRGWRDRRCITSGLGPSAAYVTEAAGRELRLIC